MARRQTEKPSAKALLENLTQHLEPQPPVVAKRPEMTMEDPLRRAVFRWGAAASLGKLVDARIELEKSVIHDACFEKWTEDLWKHKSRPANPEINIEENGRVVVEAIFIVQERYTFDFPQVQPGQKLQDVVADDLSTRLAHKGMPEAEAKAVSARLVTEELTLKPKYYIDLDALSNGHFEGEGKNKTFVEATAQQQDIAARLLRLLPEHFSREELQILLPSKTKVAVKPGFLQRVTTYAQSLDQLKEIFSTVVPTCYPKLNSFGATEKERKEMQLAVASDILAESKEGGQ